MSIFEHWFTHIFCFLVNIGFSNCFHCSHGRVVNKILIPDLFCKLSSLKKKDSYLSKSSGVAIQQGFGILDANLCENKIEIYKVRLLSSIPCYVNFFVIY